VRYILETIETVKRTGKTDDLSFFYVSLGRLHEELADPGKAAEYYKAAVAEAVKTQATIHILNGTRWVVKNLLLAGKVKQAHDFFSPIFAKYPSYDYNSDIIHLDVRAQYAIASKNFLQAEKSLLAMLKYEDKSVGFVDFPLLLNLQIGDFYLNTRKMDQARFYFQKANALVAQKRSQSVANVIRLHKAFFKLDSAQGHHVSAIAHYQRDRILSDSILTAKKSLQIAGLQIQYDTRKKEQDIAILTKENRSQHSRIEQKDFQRNLMVGGSAILLIILLLGYNQYRAKQRANEEIARKNIKQQRLIEEKEWLLKEIHHRVKNNLQTIMSLLESQSMNLENDALSAVKDSQHRVQAMALIHQKLYLTENVTTIDVQTYIQELVGYLKDSFSTRQRIHFQLEIQPINLDLTQAIPLGLILNEAITNVIKYAFPGDLKGILKISMLQRVEGDFLLEISDDGIGLSPDFQEKSFRSLGMKLMRGLTNEIGGSFHVESVDGTRVAITFPNPKVFTNSEKVLSHSMLQVT
jgi:two-component sensor histidine kinase